MADEDDLVANTTASTGAQREALRLPYFRQLPLEALAAGAVGLEYGAEKYAPRNWEKGLPWQQMIDSLRRHLDSFERRAEMDKGDSELPHICLVMSSAMMLVASVVRGIGDDDRLPAPDAVAMTPKEAAGAIRKVLDDAAAVRACR